MDRDDGTSTISALIARIEAYTSDSGSFSIPASWTRHEQWLPDEDQRIDAATQLAEELMALQSIYTDDAIHILRISPLDGQPLISSDEQLGKEDVADPNAWLPGCKLTLSVSTDVETTNEDPIPIRLAATLPPFYPHSVRPPQLQLLSKYVGGFSVDAKLFGEILRAFYHQVDDASGEAADAEETSATAAWIGGSMDKGVQWSSGEVVLFEGIEWVKEKVTDWWNEKEAERVKAAPSVPASDDSAQSASTNITTFSDPTPAAQRPSPFAGTLHQTQPIIERKSEFIGYAARLTSPDQVASVLSRILSDKRVARATHPIINAWMCKAADGVVHRDCDDDGETAAGGRLAHLLSILELENVIVVVTRWYGGVHLGPDRFKLINRAAREALDLGGFVGKNAGEDAGKGKGMGKRIV
ncbi:Protein IMPACT-like protein [Pseudozyma hubeiensis]|nr:Protein IMPACT-like protein [Pseudozyma hubeiensis]